MTPKLSVGLLQDAPHPSVEANIVSIGARSANLGVDLVICPENCLFAGAQSEIGQIARSKGDWLVDLGKIAQAADAIVVFGGVPVREGSHVRNAMLVVSPTGQLLARYDKIHLFQLFGDTAAVDETLAYQPGTLQPVTIDVKGWRIGLSICYDLRFPELYRAYAGCDAMICTAAFTRHTGRAHWELLCRARAVENQCWFLAAGTCGRNEITNHESWGHSMIVDAWGRIVAQCGDDPAIVRYELDHASTTAVREKLPALKSRRLLPENTD